MAFDDCPPSIDPEIAPVNQARLRQAAERDAAPESGRGWKRRYDHPARLRTANERTVRWLERCRDEHARLGSDRCALFGIVQGGTDLDQRTWSAERICAVDLPGYAIGGVAVGEQFEDIARVVRHTAPLLPESKPRYLMGVGYERDLYAAVMAGVDMFDCVLPTRNGRNASAFTRAGQVRLRNAQFAEDPRVLEEDCDCVACTGRGPGMFGDGSVPMAESGFSRAYIRHLFFAREMLGPILVSLHNLRYFQRFMADLRDTIRSEDCDGFLRRWPTARPDGRGEVRTVATDG